MIDHFDELHNDAIKVLIFFGIVVLAMLVFDFLKTYVDQLLELSVFCEHWDYAGHVNLIWVKKKIIHSFRNKLIFANGIPFETRCLKHALTKEYFAF